MIRQRLLSFVADSTTLFQNLPQNINIAEQSLNEAEREFVDGAFAPFWDAVERAASHLAYFDRDVRQIQVFSGTYKKEKKELDSTPPTFQLDVNSLPDAMSTANRMCSIVRLAQKDFQFSTIYEQRKTNQILVAGFTSLGQTLSEMSSRLASSIEALSGSISEFAINNQKSTESLLEQLQSDAMERRTHEEEEREIAESFLKQLQSDATERQIHEEKEREMLDNIQRRKKPN